MPSPSLNACAAVWINGMPMHNPPPHRILPYGNNALLLRFEADDPAPILPLIWVLAHTLRRDATLGAIDVIATMHEIAVHFPYGTSLPDKVHHIETLLQHLSPKNGHRAAEHHIPVCYDFEYASDLPGLLRMKGLSLEEFVQIHTSRTYRVGFIGFMPGFGYLTGLDARLHTPRKANPSIRIPAGSVAIGASFCGIYPLQSPGGWHIIGRTPQRIFWPHRDPPCLLQPGDVVVFHPIDRDEFQQLFNETHQ